MAWGLCRNCKWWQIEPGAPVAPTTIGFCIDEDLQPYQLSIAGNGGCANFMKGEPARAAGSGTQPPAAEPVR